MEVTMVRLNLCVACLVLLLAGPAGAQEGHPPAITPEGESIPLAGQARRTHLLGAVEFYDIALYASTADRAHLLSPDVPKALRIEVTHEDDLHRRVTLDWRRELVPLVELPAAAHLRGSFAPLQQGDVVLIAYVPGKGTTVRVNKGLAASGEHHD
jgi:hypothetical protein